MGVSNYTRYKATSHAKERYLERIDNSKNELGMLKDFSAILSKSRFLSKEKRGRESWLCEARNIVTIINPTKYSIVTIYSSVEEYDSLEQLSDEVKEIHPKVRDIISNASKQAHKQQEKSYFAKLAPMYKEYSERIDNLSRMKNQKYFDNKKIELKELQREITRVVAEKNRVLKDLEQFELGG